MTSRLEQIQAMLADDPNDPFLRYGLAMEYVSQGNDEEAVRCFRGMIQDLPDYVPAYQQAAQTLVRLNRVEEARDTFRLGIAAAARTGNRHAHDEMQGMLDELQ
jgi:cytochrome c-type biogenesis protein CcmH/NrfG